MIRSAQSPGLIVSTAAHRTAALDELAWCLNWPVVAAATPHKMSGTTPVRELKYLLFWLEDHREVSATVNLVTWFRDRSPHAYRIAVAYRLNEHVEPAIRQAGTQVYLSATKVSAVVDEAIRPLLEEDGWSPVERERARAPTRSSGIPPDSGKLLHAEHPP